jgi:calcineurin-like phosphoesterase family protein
MKTFIISDTHFGQHNMYKFVDRYGSRMRAWADNAYQGDEYMIEKWNSVVGPNDKVYHLGDIAMPKKSIALLGRLNGRKVLIRGNHDKFKLKDYTPYFKDVRGMHKLDRYILTHYPVHPMSISHWCRANIHGHIHEKTVMKRLWWGKKVPDRRYYNVCVEQHDCVPQDFEQIRAYVESFV